MNPEGFKTLNQAEETLRRLGAEEIADDLYALGCKLGSEYASEPQPGTWTPPEVGTAIRLLVPMKGWQVGATGTVYYLDDDEMHVAMDEMNATRDREELVFYSVVFDGWDDVQDELEVVAPLPAVGTKVRLLHDVDRFPHFVAPKGATGVVSNAEDGVFCVLLDEKLVGAEDWDNEVMWSVRDGDDPQKALEVITDGSE